MKRLNWTVCAVVSLVLAAAAEDGHFDLTGDLTIDGVAAVPLTVDLYRACGAGEGRLGRELRVQDSQGIAQPYVVRRRCTFKAQTETQFESCKIRGLSENADGSITLTAAVREDFDISKVQVSGVEIGTSLKDFAQMVVIRAVDGTNIAEGRIFDYTRFAAVRSTKVAVDGKLPREFTITLRRPVTELESAAFERVVSTGAVNSVSIRRLAQEQSFRVDAVRVCYQTTSMTAEPLPLDRVTLAGGETENGRYVYEAHAAPIEMAQAAPRAENWAFDVVVEEQSRVSGQRAKSRERLYAIQLPNRISAKRNFSCRPDPEDGCIRFQIDRGDNPPVDLGDPPFVFLMEPYEVVFVAKRGEHYRLTFDRGADAPRYSDGVLAYLRSETSAQTLTAVQVGDFDVQAHDELTIWIQKNWATTASLLVLVALVFVCLRSFGKVSLITVVLLLGAGCATSPMKSTPFYEGSESDSTGKLASRVNLWPLAYYREPALSALWPVFSLADDHFAIRPIYSQYRQGGKNAAFDEFNFLWPICQVDTKHKTQRVLPFYWSEYECGLFPLFSWKYDRSAKIFPLVWWKKNQYFNIFPLWWSTPDEQMLLPVYYQDKTSIAFYPFYGKTTTMKGETQWYGPVGWHRGKDGDSDWCFPFYYRDDSSFISLPWISSRDAHGKSLWFSPLLLSGGASGGEGSKFFSPVWCAWQDDKPKSDIWALPPLLTWGESGEKGWKHCYLFGLAGIARKNNGDYADWLWPFYHRDNDNFYSPPFVSLENGRAYIIPPLLTMFDKRGNVGTPLFGWDSSCSWVTPLYYRDKRSFASPLYCHWTHGDDTTTIIPPLLAKFERFGDGRAENCLLLGLAGWSSAPERGVYKSRLFPFYCYNAKRGEFLSIPFGHTSDITFVTPLVGVTHKYHNSGGWLWPLFGWVGDDRMAGAEDVLAQETLAPQITIERQEYKGPQGKAANKTTTYYTVRGVENAYERAWQLSGLSTSNHSISWRAADKGKTVVADEADAFGNSFAYKSTLQRRVMFDVASRKRTSIDEKSEASVFFGWLWHYANHNGNVTIDAFPAFTYDSRTNGYTKTSFLWRLYRNEYDPAKGREIDFLFLPIWR